ncbi:hypothetical protein [Runella limosa]|uniref:hypothetical protein n=1 Tax=Runella limosa TaxID=370978 RepID=UPI00048B65F5|nr:hypothetical protein [Runella limosa]
MTKLFNQNFTQMRSLSKSFFVLICCLVLNQKVVGQGINAETSKKAEKILLESEIERALMNDKISRDDIQHCFKLMQAYADLSAPQNREQPTHQQVIPLEKDWINWVEFNTLLAAFLVIFLTLKGLESIEKRKKLKRQTFSFEQEIGESVDELWTAVVQIQHDIREIKGIKDSDDD